MSEGNSHFLMAIGRIDGGLAVEVADEKLRDVLAAVQRTGKKGSVSITIEIAANGEMGFAASAKVAAKAPMIDFGQSFFFVDRKGDLTRNAPDLLAQGHFKKDETNV